jgi:hypothetical protein
MPGGSFDLPPIDGESIHQAVDPVERVMFGLVSQVGIADGGENRLMAEEFLNLDQIDTGLDQVRGITVA